MMNLRKLTYPLSFLYGGITKLRNKMFDSGLLKSIQFTTPVIVVGNLSVGGTGKTPQIEYLIRLFRNEYQVAVLSRGYKRKSKGFILADENSTAELIGDEPFQFYKKFDDVSVAVDADRVKGIKKLKTIDPQPNLFLLDDAFQHRRVAANFYILLTTYNDLYVDDKMLPAGNLRENVKGADRAKIIVVTKCPEDLSKEKQKDVVLKLDPNPRQQVYFTTIDYSEVVKNNNRGTKLSELQDHEVILVTGIANSKPLEDYLTSKNIKFKHLKYPDHHRFLEKDLNYIKSEFEAFTSEKKIILTTEKDYVRLKDQIDIYYLEIKIKFLNKGKEFDETLLRFAEEASQS